jgi:hypothetical protein
MREKESYERELAALREENDYLRAAAHSFGELAERLASELQRLRAQTDGRGTARWRPQMSSGRHTR